MEIGRTRCDKNKRITLLKELADLMMIQEGDHIKFIIKDGIAIIQKDTELYNGFDIEGMEIQKRLQKYEEVMEMLENPIPKYENKLQPLTPEEEWKQQQDLKDAYELYDKELKRRMKNKNKTLI